MIEKSIIFAPQKKPMVHQQVITCLHCCSNDLHKNGRRSSGIQYWRCCQCKKSFQLDYRYNARRPGVKEQITELTLNSSGVRDISRVLKIAKNTVISELKKRNYKNQSILSSWFRECNTWKPGSWDPNWRRDGWVLEFCTRQDKSKMDVVCNRTPVWRHTCVAQR